MTALIVVLAVAWLAVLLVAGLPVWDRDPRAAGRPTFTNARNIRRASRPRHVRVPLADLIGDPP